jgi:hypothetical protein
MSMGLGYYVIRDKIPFLVYFLYLLMRDREGYHENLIFALINWSYLMAVIFFIYAHLRGLTLWFQWTYASPISWGLTALLITGLLMKKGHDLKFSTMMGSVSVSMGGYVYELPRFIREGQSLIRAQPHNVFIISFQILSIFIFMFYYLQYRERVSVRTMLISLVWLYHGYLFYLNHHFLRVTLVEIVGNFHYRAPMIFLILSLLWDTFNKDPSQEMRNFILSVEEEASLNEHDRVE